LFLVSAGSVYSEDAGGVLLVERAFSKLLGAMESAATLGAITADEERVVLFSLNTESKQEMEGMR